MCNQHIKLSSFTHLRLGGAAWEALTFTALHGTTGKHFTYRVRFLTAGGILNGVCFDALMFPLLKAEGEKTYAFKFFYAVLHPFLM